MSQEQSVMMIAVAIVAINWWSARSKRDKIYCTLRRSNRQKITRWIKQTDDKVQFGKYEFNVVSKCVTWQWLTGGLFGWLNPMFIPTLDYDMRNEDPLDPDDLTNDRVISPRARKLMNNEEDFTSFARGVQTQSGKKKSGFTEFLPWIAIIGVAIIGFFFYQDHQSNVAMFNQIQQIQATLKSIVK